ncbi:unnamed protein product [Cunninghamella echinulata]
MNSSQPVNLDNPTMITSGNGALSGNNSQPNSIVCPHSTPQKIGTPWLLQEDVPGYWQAVFPYPIQPSMFRISNTQLPNQATRFFSILALGSNTVFELSYVDPATQKTVTCTDMCYLANLPNMTYQDFTVVKNINTTGIRIDINSWIGIGGGLGNVQIFQSDNTINPYSSSINQNSECSGSSTTSTTGQWNGTYAYGSYQNYLTSTVPSSQLSTSNVSVTYTPNIPSQGRYTIYANTPGCVGTSTCNHRTQVEMTIEMTPNNQSHISIDQTNSEDSSIIIYDGIVSLPTSNFQPKVTLRVSPNAVAPSNSDTIIIASSLSVVRNGTNAALSSILEFSPQNYSSNQPIAWRPLADQLTPGSAVLALDASKGDKLYIGGYFSGVNNPYRNIVVYDYSTKKLTTLNANGLDGNVTAIYLSGSELYVGGQFNNTLDNQFTGLNHVAVYDTNNNVWSTLGKGTNGKIDTIFSSNDHSSIIISGDFTHTTQLDGRQLRSNGNSIWNTQQQQWMNSPSFISGSIQSWQNVSSSNDYLLIGDIMSAQTYYSVGATTFPTLTSPWAQFYSLFDNEDSAIINAGVFWENKTSNQQVTIIGGKFTMQNGAIANLAMYHDNTWSGFQLNKGDGGGAIDVVHSLLQVDDILYIGGQFTGHVKQQELKSMVIYNLADHTLLPVNSVTGANGIPGTVNVIRSSNDKTKIYIGGSFVSVGSLDCVSICQWDTKVRQWNSVGQGLRGNIQDISVGDNMVTIIGSLQVQQKETNIAQINLSSDTTWSFPTVGTLSGETDIQQLNITAINLGSSSGSFIFAGQTTDQPSKIIIGSLDSNQQFSEIASSSSSSSSSQQNTDGSSSLSSLLLPGSVINQVLLVPVMEDSVTQPRYPSNTNTVLMIVGNIQLSRGGHVTIATFDGSGWSPYVLSSQFNGQPGLAQSFFYSKDTWNGSQTRRYLPVPAVILISIAISLGLIFLLVGMGLLWMFIKRKKQGLDYPEPMPAWQPSSNQQAYYNQEATTNSQWRPASSIAAILDAAQLATLGGSAEMAIASSSQQQPQHHYDSYQQQQHIDHSSGNEFPIGSGGVAAAIGAATATAPSTFDQLKSLAALQNGETGPATEEHPQLFVAKYPFDAKEFGELGFDSNEIIVVTDTSDSIWWMGYKDDGTGKPTSGLFPSNFVIRAS